MELELARWQFALTTVYHFFFVPLTLGLSILLALMESAYVRSGDVVYKRMAQFWGKLFLINFAMGVATGIVQEFQFGMNWSEYSRFVGDIFGVPLAIEALLAFFLESTFLGLWVFGWGKLSKPLHAATIWLVAIGANVSALWILIANSFMHEPVGYVLRNGRAEMTDFFALLANPHVWVQYPHVLLSGLTTAAFFVLGISAYHLLKKSHLDVFQRSFRWAAVAGLIGSLGVAMIGHTQAQHMVRAQPMKMAAAEALWEDADPAGLSLFTISDEQARRDIVDIRVPRALSLLAYNRLDGKVRGVNSIEAEYQQSYGPGNYAPPVFLTYWSFRVMVGAGLVLIALALAGLYVSVKNRFEHTAWLLRLLPLAVALPYVANTAGWLMTELGRQPWVVFGLMKTADAVSQTVSPGMVLFSLVSFGLLYAVLMAVDVYLVLKYAKAGPPGEGQAPLIGAY
jgi:cytochrome d ubiquinol oxidase subunit I